MNELFNQIFEQLLEERGLSTSDVSRATGISKSSFSSWKNGTAAPKGDKIYTIAQFFNVPMEIFYGGEETVRHQKPVYEVAAGQGRINESYSNDYMDDAEDGYEYCHVVGDSMYPVLRDGDIVVVRPQTDVRPNDFAVVKIDGESATIKHVEITDKGVWLRAENKEVFKDKFYTVQEVMTLPVTIIGKAVEIRRSL